MMKLLIKRWYVFIIIIIASGIFFYQRRVVKSQAQKIKTHVVKKQTIKETLSIAGQIEAEERAVLKFQTSGMLAWVGVKKGDYVKKYQGIASLDRRELEKNLKKYLNTYLETRWDYDQTKENYKDKAITDAMQRVIDKAQFDLNSSVIDVELKDIALKYAYLYSPIEGIVARLDTPYPGVNITPSTAEFEIVNPNTVYFSANADQTEVIKLREKMRGEITLDAYADQKLKGSIDMISFTPKTGESGTVYEIKIKMTNNNQQYKYKVGMTGDVTFDLVERKNIMAVPSSFVKTENGKKYVTKIKDNSQIKTFVKVGEELDGDIEIKSGLKSGEVIIQ